MTVIQNLGIVKHGRRAVTPRKNLEKNELDLVGKKLLLPETELNRIKTTLTKEADFEKIRQKKIQER